MEYTIIRSRRRTLALQILPSGEIVVRAPLLVSKKQIDRFVESKAQWLQKHLSRRANRPTLPPFSADELALLKKQAKAALPPRVHHFAAQMGISYGTISIRSQRTRWGSCSLKGNLNFNCLLMLVPEDVRDYVIVHELCHLLELNHSPRFWREVEAVLPDYKIRRKWLKENGSALIARLEAT